MKKVLFLFLISLVGFNVKATTSVEKLSVKKIDNNVYKDFTCDVIIITESCPEYAYSEDALLVNDNELVFKDTGEGCDVKQIIRNKKDSFCNLM